VNVATPKSVLAFDSPAFPAKLANDPDASTEAKGKACFERLLSLLEDPTISRGTGPGHEGSGFSAYVDVGGVSVAIHLTWFPAGPPRGRTRDVWTLQAHRARHGLLDMLRDGDKLAADPAADTVRAALMRVLESNAEFANPRWCAWRDLET
jgi:hypothetical protein